MVRLATKAAGNDVYFAPNDDLDFEDEDLDRHVLSGESYDDIGGPTQEVLDEWAKDPLANEVLEGFQSDEETGSKRLSFRDVYRLLEVLGLDRTEFIAGLGGDDEDFDDESFDGEVDSDYSQTQHARFQKQRQ